MAGYDIIVIGGSAGSVEALKDLVRTLPGDLPAAVFAVIHVWPYAESNLPAVLNRAGPLPAAHAQHGEPIVPGRIYAAPPDFHLLLEKERVVLSHGARENGTRPEESSMASEIDRARTIIAEDMSAQSRGQRHGMPSVYTCPECGGVMWQLDEESVLRFQCHTGHIYSFQHLLVEQTEALENALWQAIRALQQKAVMARQVLNRNENISPDLRERFREQAEASEANVELLRRLVENSLFSPQEEALSAERLSEQPEEGQDADAFPQEADPP